MIPAVGGYITSFFNIQDGLKFVLMSDLGRNLLQSTATCASVPVPKNKNSPAIRKQVSSLRGYGDGLGAWRARSSWCKTTTFSPAESHLARSSLLDGGILSLSLSLTLCEHKRRSRFQMQTELRKRLSPGFSGVPRWKKFLHLKQAVQNFLLSIQYVFMNVIFISI